MAATAKRVTGTHHSRNSAIIRLYPMQKLMFLRPADSVKAGGYFFYAGKTLIGAFQGIFHGGRDFFDL